MAWLGVWREARDGEGGGFGVFLFFILFLCSAASAGSGERRDTKTCRVVEGGKRGPRHKTRSVSFFFFVVVADGLTPVKRDWVGATGVFGLLSGMLVVVFYSALCSGWFGFSI